MISLKGKKALITGGSRGIGRASAILFAKAGMDVAINFFLSQEKAALEVKQKVNDLGRDCVVLKTDISEKSQVDKMDEALRHDCNRIDILVYNAGIWTLAEMEDKECMVWDEILQLNLDAVFFLGKAYVPLMKAEKEGWTVNVNGGSMLCA
jgi:3-oxoacyl-[acyl-carrier protein] reductase